MKKLLLIMTLLSATIVAGAQRVYFVYLQTDNGAPFYVRIGEKVHSASAAGYAILSNLKDSSYVLQVGFPGQTAESRFPVTVGHEDRGFVLKQVGGAWNLFDLQQLTLIPALAATGPTDAENEALLAAADPFMRMLVQATDDMSLLHGGPSAPAPSTIAQLPARDTGMTSDNTTVTSAIMPPPVKPVAATPVNTVMAAGAQVAAQKLASADTVPAAVVPAEPAFVRSQVTRRSESSTTEGFGLVFIDRQEGGSDTIRLLIPNPKVTAAAPVPVDTVLVSAGRAADADTVLVATAAAKTDTILVARPVTETKTAATTPAVTDCKSIADEKDMARLRRNMAAASDDAERLSIARKTFKGRCFSTAQVRELGGLFGAELPKYNFFEAAQGHLTDPAQFTTLGAELKDPYFSKRFQQLAK
ncbi:hypothetical protein EPD60_03550 [Flaviaesturariibacter flavus]|uniref:DUF4476 domain-containing protein n=1 Tax=Flaviaesturariibacter flavus TaxID=2502780 RepID=A0A4R1BMD9_9BACT|nr:hypothetical protein [Flaviaesturariibacter flavus]TCJ18589.1 hypothetical protein EPD60_03550 [Flaviaesturariibacter flavus]